MRASGLPPNVDVLNECTVSIDLDVKMHVIVKDDDIIVDHIGDVTIFKYVSEFTIGAVRMERSNYTVSNTHDMSLFCSGSMYFRCNKARWNVE